MLIWTPTTGCDIGFISDGGGNLCQCMGSVSIQILISSLQWLRKSTSPSNWLVDHSPQSAYKCSEADTQGAVVPELKKKIKNYGASLQVSEPGSNLFYMRIFLFKILIMLVVKYCSLFSMFLLSPLIII